MLILLSRLKAIPPRRYVLFFGLALTAGSLLLDFFTGRPFGIGYVQAAGLVLGVLLTLVATLSRWMAMASYLSLRLLFFLSLFISVLGVVLLVINLIGLPLSMRNEKMYTQSVRYGGKERLALYTPKEIYSQMTRGEDESVKDYVVRVTTLIHQGTIHYWLPQGKYEYNLVVPIWENWILWLNNYGDIYLFCGTERAIERGATVCVQSTVILLGLMHSQGIDAEQYALGGHTVALVQVDPQADVWWFADADFGTVIPMDYRVVEERPENILPYYRLAGYADEPRLLDNLVTIYGKPGDYAQGGIDDFKYCKREEDAYRLKWIIPAAAMLQFVVLVIPIQRASQRMKQIRERRG